MYDRIYIIYNGNIHLKIQIRLFELFEKIPVCTCNICNVWKNEPVYIDIYLSVIYTRIQNISITIR